jgi:cytoskeletal protein CcmA (bactofilin family)
MALLQIRRGNSGTKGTLQYGEPFFNSSLQTVQFGADGNEEITLVKLNTGIAGANVWGESGSFENSGSLSLMGDITASNAFFRGNVFVSGNLRLGNNDLDSITVDADFTSDLIPNTSSTYDIGAGGKTWANVYTDNLTLSALSGLDAENNIVYVNSSNALTASNDFEYIPGDQVRIGSGLVDKFTVSITTGNTFISGNLEVHGNTGIFVSGNISSSQGIVTAISAGFDNLRPTPSNGLANDSIVISSNGYLYNDSNLRFVGNGLDIGNGKFLVNKTNGNTDIDGYLQIRGNITSSANAIIKGTLQVDGGTTLNNSLNVLGSSSNVNINQNLRVDGSGSFGNGLDVAGNVVLNVGGAGIVFVSGSTTLGDNPQNDSVLISGSFTQIFTGTARENLFVRNSAVRKSSITFDDDNSADISGLGILAGKIVIRNQNDNESLDSHTQTGVYSSGITLSNTGSGFGAINISYTGNPVVTSVTNPTRIKVNISATDGINLNSNTQIASNLSVSGSTILGRDNDDLLTIASPTTMSGDLWNQGYIANLGTVKIASSLEVTGSTLLLGTVTLGDLRTKSGSGILGSASFDSDVTVGRDLYVNGTRTSFKPKLIEIASGSTAGFEAEGAGLYVSTSLLGGNASIRYTTTGSSERFIINKGVYIIGDPNDNYGLQISNNAHITGNLDVDGDLAVQGTITLVNANITNAAINTLNVTASAAVTGNLEVNGNLSVTGSTTLGDAAGDNVQIPGTLNVSGAVKNGSTLNVSGAVGFNNVLRVTGSTAISGGLFVSGNTTLSSSLTVKESASFEKNLRVSGNLQVDGNVDILGEVVRINVSNLQIEDKNVIISRGSLSSLQSNDGGITIEGPTEPIQFTWDHANQRMNLNKDLNVSGNLLIQGDNIIDTAVALAIALS